MRGGEGNEGPTAKEGERKEGNGIGERRRGGDGICCLTASYASE